MTIKLQPSQMEAANHIFTVRGLPALGGSILNELAAVLQIPQPDLSHAEFNIVLQHIGSASAFPISVNTRYREAFHIVMAARNADLQPKPVDPGRDRMRVALASFLCKKSAHTMDRCYEWADEMLAILAAIHKEKP